jgi:hypothetical protein
MQQTWSAQERLAAHKDYLLEPAKPFVNGEYGYDGLWGMTRATTRLQAWTVYMCGGAGANYGVHGIWWWNDGDRDSYLQDTYGSSPRWYEVIDSASGSDMTRIVDFFTAREWWKLKRHDSLVVGGYCLAEPGRQYISFNPFGPTTQVPGLASPISARWYNPRNGSYQPAGNGPAFTRPTSEDWVLAIDVLPSPVRDAVAPEKRGGIRLEIQDNTYRDDTMDIRITGGTIIAPAQMSVLDTRGARVRFPVPQPGGKGDQSWVLDKAGLPAGMYILECVIGPTILRKKLILVR